MPRKSSLFPENYNTLLDDLKTRIRQAQVRAALAVNQELTLLYWQIGREIVIRQQKEGWGSKVISRLAKDLKQEFPSIAGFSARNLNYMRAFAAAYPDEEIVQRCVAKIPWRHNIALIEKLKSPEEKLWYAQKALENGWSRDVLVLQVESDLYHRQGGAITNFKQALPEPQSDLAHQLLKDPYNFDFLTLSENAQERDLERALVDRIRDFLLELGVGFAFVGSQYHLEIDGQDFYIDLLFYHIRLHCYVVIDLKITPFQPEYSGKLNFYISAVDDLLRQSEDKPTIGLRLHCYVVIDLKITPFQPEYSGKLNFYISAVDDLLRQSEDKPTIGLVLCRGKSNAISEYALRDINKPIGISTYKLQDDLPDSLKGNLPSIEQLEIELEAAASDIEAKAAESSK